MSRWLSNISKDGVSTASWATCASIQSRPNNKKVFSDVQREQPVFQSCSLSLVCLLKRMQHFCSGPRRWKLTYVFCSSVQLKCVAQDSPWQNLWFMLGRERCESCTVSNLWVQGLEVDLSLIPKMWNITFSHLDKHFPSRIWPSDPYSSATSSSTSLQN